LSPRIAGSGWEGRVIEPLLAAAPEGAQTCFYRTAVGAEIDLVLTLPGEGPWAIEIKRSLTPTLERGFHHACEDGQPDAGLSSIPVPSVTRWRVAWRRFRCRNFATG